MRILLVLSIIAIRSTRGQDHDNDKHTTAILRPNVNFRQLIIPLASPAASSSYDYWPYSPSGASPPTTTTVSPIVQQTPSIIPSLSPAPISSDSDSSFTFSPTNSLILSSLFLPTMLASNSPQDASPTSSVVVTITPLSSLNSSSSTFKTYPKSHILDSKTMMYLIPVFVVVGIVLGSILAWFTYGCCTRKPRLRTEDILQVGPAYIPGSPAEREKGLHEGFSYPSQPVSAYGWDALEPNLHLWSSADDGGRGYDDGEDVTLLAPGSRSTKPAYPQRNLGRTQTTNTVASVSVYSQMDEDELKTPPPPSQQRLVSRRRARHFLAYNPADEDATSFLDSYESDGEDEKTPTNATVRTQKRVVSRRRPTHTKKDSEYTVDNVSRSTTTTSGDGGFKILQESPLSSRGSTPSSEKGLFWYQGQNGRYPPINGEKSRSPRKRTSHPLLPQSPPQVLSPNLAGGLCFTPKLR